MISSSTINFFYLVCILFCLCINVSSQSKSDNITELYINANKVNGDNISSIASNISSVYNIPIGFEPEAEDLSKIKNIDDRKYVVESGQLREVLDNLIKINPSYSWSFDGKVINIFPIENKDIIIEQILDTYIENISFDKYKGKMTVGENLFKSKELNKLSESLNIKDVHFYRANDLLNKNATIINHYEFNQKTVRQILNNIIYINEDKFWIISRWGGNNQLITILTS